MKSYVNDLLGVVGNLQSFRNTAHRIGGVLVREYIERYSRSNNTALIPILRAGSAFEKSFLKWVFPSPIIYYIATKRDSVTLEPKILYKTFWRESCEKADRVIVLEPMLATGGTMLMVIDEINNSFKPKQIVVISAFVSRKAEETIGNKATIITLSRGHDLNEKGYILIPDPYDPKKVATLDFGDEYCGTYSH